MKGTRGSSTALGSEGHACWSSLGTRACTTVLGGGLEYSADTSAGMVSGCSVVFTMGVFWSADCEQTPYREWFGDGEGDSLIGSQ